jgi:hypothetical protein
VLGLGSGYSPQLEGSFGFSYYDISSRRRMGWDFPPKGINLQFETNRDAIGE